MSRKDFNRRSTWRVRATRTAVAVAALCGLALSMSASALAKAPTGDYAVFSQCPRFTKGVNFCIYSLTTSGSATIGKQEVPIAKTITLQGGIIRNEATEAESFVGALNGETLTKVPQKVPGGLSGLVNCAEIKGEGFLEKGARVACEAVFENALTGVNATTELATPATTIGINKNNLVNRTGVALTLPVKVHLENPFLGSECYIGSSAHPLTWSLTTGTTAPPAPNKPITGKVGEFGEKDEGEIVEILGNQLANNSFAAPEATGCGGLAAFLVDPIIDAKVGVPATSGHNTVILNNKIELTAAENVIASEK